MDTNRAVQTSSYLTSILGLLCLLQIKMRQLWKVVIYLNFPSVCRVLSTQTYTEVLRTQTVLVYIQFCTLKIIPFTGLLHVSIEDTCVNYSGNSLRQEKRSYSIFSILHVCKVKASCMFSQRCKKRLLFFSASSRFVARVFQESGLINWLKVLQNKLKNSNPTPKPHQAQKQYGVQPHPTSEQPGTKGQRYSKSY